MRASRRVVSRSPSPGRRPAPTGWAWRWKRLGVLVLEDRSVPAHFTIAGIWDGNPMPAGTLRLDEAAIRTGLADVPALSSGAAGHVVTLPDPRGAGQRFRVWEMSMMEPGLAAQFPEIRTFRGQGIDDPSAVLAADVTLAGFHAQVLAEDGWSIMPTQTVSDGHYSVIYTADDPLPHNGCACALCAAAAAGGEPGPTLFAPPPGEPPETTFGANLRSFRLAVAAAGEYTADAGGSVALALSAITTVINTVNAIYERDCGVHFNLVANNNLIIYTDAATDPYTGTSVTTMLGQNQSNLTSVIGSANYDIGHVFGGLNQGGVASLGVVGNSSTKARGVSTTSNGQPTGNWMNFVTCHEIGHQFNAGHTFNGVSASLDPNRMSGSAWEPGAGDSIMAYPHVTANGQAYSSVFQTYFHAGSINQIVSFVNSIPGVGTTTPTGNGVPAVNAGPDRTIPANTPFLLTMTATDPDGDTLLLGFDQMNLGPALSLGAADNGSSPLFRIYFPAAGKFTRSMPNLTNLLANKTYAPETLPSTNRTLTFRAVARDNKAGGPALDTDDVKYTVVNTGSAFAVTAPNTAVTFNGNSTQTVTWNVAGTTANGINTAKVNILLSTDGGLTYPTTLAAATANDGSEAVTIPNVATTTARIKVEAVGNIFFDVSNANFTITKAPSTFVVTNTADAGAGSLRAAVLSANGTPGPDFITFDPAVFANAQTITLSSGELGITDAVTITGPGAKLLTVSGNNASRVFNLNIPGVGGAVAISGVTIAAGSAAAGAGVLLQDDALTLTDCTVVGNAAAGGDGGGIRVQAGGSLTLRGCTLSGNSADRGAAISLSAGGGTLLVENSTISGNAAVSLGGGVYFRGPAGSVTARSSTITANSAGTSGGGVYRSSLGAGSIDLAGSILSGNTGGAAPDVYSTGPVTANFSAVGSAGGFTLTGADNLPFGADLKLGPLADNGGPTPTHALLPLSPAINAGSNPAGLSFDQRGAGFARVIGSAADIGAFEAQFVTPPSKVTGITVNDGTAQRSRVTSLTVAFDQPVSFSGAPEAAFQIQRQSDGSAVTLAASVDDSGPGTVVTLTFTGGPVEFGSLADGRFTLTVDAGQVANANGQLDGDGDGIGGDNFVVVGSPANGLFRLFGDADGDGDVDATDFGAFRLTFGTAANLAFDFDSDGDVDAADFGQFRLRFGTGV
jgi:hypothetical protein